MENKGEEAQAHSHSRNCVTVLYPRNTIKKGGRRMIESSSSCVPSLSLIHTHHYNYCVIVIVNVIIVVVIVIIVIVTVIVVTVIVAVIA